ncbi:hypothetical protein NLG97_g198 [Lecanicillium saksenae]|uniref:Uncharacterized protein n=1 Tax=Lecanicillium saksenae TaxID=468837 RepID=A0ACC1R942_9HYPO|nr:hypothetical protein NLG97_g198 [Lecanicillium saksenae]
MVRVSSSSAAQDQLATYIDNKVHLETDDSPRLSNIVTPATREFGIVIQQSRTLDVDGRGVGEARDESLVRALRDGHRFLDAKPRHSRVPEQKV